MKLGSLLQKDRILVIEACKDRDELFARLADAVPGLAESPDALIESLKAREELKPTSTPEGVAFPHAIRESIGETSLVVASIKGGTDFRNPDHPFCDLVFCMFGSPAKPWEHLQLIARLARISRGDEALDRLKACEDSESLYAALIEEDRSHV